MRRAHNFTAIHTQILERGWNLNEGKEGYSAFRTGQATPLRNTMEAVLEDIDRIACHMIPGELGPNGHGAKETLKTEYACHSVTSKGPFAEGAGAYLDFYRDHLQILVYDKLDEAAVYVRLNREGTIAEIVLRDRSLLNLCVCEGEPRMVSQWEKERDNL